MIKAISVLLYRRFVVVVGFIICCDIAFLANFEEIVCRIINSGRRLPVEIARFDELCNGQFTEQCGKRSLAVGSVRYRSALGHDHNSCAVEMALRSEAKRLRK